jgi:cytochrome P450
VLTRLIQGEAAGKAQRSELLQNCVFILNAGHETTTNLIGNALVALQEWPAAKAALLQAIGNGTGLAGAGAGASDAGGRRVPALRVVQPAGQPARAAWPAKVGGVAVARRRAVTLCIGAANRDPAQFERPDQLDLARQDNRHLAFGFGIHQCAGLSLARLEGRIAIGRFLQRFPATASRPAPTRGGRARFAVS